MVAEPVADASAQLASIPQRIGARLVDGLIFLVPYLALTVPLADENSAGDLRVPLWTSYVMLAVTAVYEITMVAVRGQTLGKMALRCRVVRSDGSGSLPSLWSAAIRYLLPAAVAGIPIVTVQLASVLIYLWALWDPNRQGLHDKAAGTMVVRTA